MKIISSAIKMKNGRVYTGKRHNNCLEVANIAGEKTPIDCVQGFVTDGGEFVTREVASQIAFEAGQIKERLGTLYSEDIFK